MAVAKGQTVFTDIRSGMRFSTRKGLMKLLKLVEEDKVSRIYITHRDRLARFGFEDISGIRKSGDCKGKEFRTSLNRWPYRLYQKMIGYKSPFKTVYVNPRGTSSECPVCGGKLKHPSWGISRCERCGAVYDRKGLVSLAIVGRGLRL